VISDTTSCDEKEWEKVLKKLISSEKTEFWELLYVGICIIVGSDGCS